MDNTDTTGRIEISEVLKNISDELWQANEQAKQSNKATMVFTECEIEFAIETEAKANAGVKIYVVNLGGDAKRSDKNTVKLKFTALSEKPFVALGTADVSPQSAGYSRQPQPNPPTEELQSKED